MAVLTRRQKIAIAAWATGWTVGGLVDWKLSRGEANGDTLSECIRAVLPDWAFELAFDEFSDWFRPHILNGYG
jgi:hypothetical protein